MVLPLALPRCFAVHVWRLACLPAFLVVQRRRRLALEVFLVARFLAVAFFVVAGLLDEDELAVVGFWLDDDEDELPLGFCEEPDPLGGGLEPPPEEGGVSAFWNAAWQVAWSEHGKPLDWRKAPQLAASVHGGEPNRAWQLSWL